MDTIRRFCTAVEATPGLAAVAAKWRLALGDAHAWTTPLLRATDALAPTYPKLEPDPPWPRPYDVVCHDAAADDYVGVCPGDPGDRLALTRSELIIYELDARALAARVAAALGLVPDVDKVGGLVHTYQAGVRHAVGGSGGGERVYLSLPFAAEHLDAVLASLVLRHAEPFLVLTPTRSAWRAWPESLRRRAVVVALNEALEAGEAGTFVPRHSAHELLEPVRVSVRPAPAPPGIGLLRIEDVPAAYPHLSREQVDRVRKELEAFRRRDEDAVMATEPDPVSNRRRYAYPAAAVARAVEAILAREARRRR